MSNLGEGFLEVVWQDLCQDFFKDLRITAYHRVSVISWSVTRVSTIIVLKVPGYFYWEVLAQFFNLLLIRRVAGLSLL